MSVIERYKVQFLGGPLADVERWKLDAFPRLVMGGSLLGHVDWAHLQNDFGVTHCLNLETEHSDVEIVPTHLLREIPQPDDGQGKPPHWFHSGLLWANFLVDESTPSAVLYVHCQAGGSRTPLMVYTLLRGIYQLQPGASLVQIQTVKPSFGSHPSHVNYLASAEQALGQWLGCTVRGTKIGD